jgi:hypothetical protein
VDGCGSCGDGLGRLFDFQELRISANCSAANASASDYNSAGNDSAQSGRHRE